MAQDHTSTSSKKTIGINQGFIVGEITNVRQYDGTYYHQIKIPQETGDYRFAYVDISSKRRLGGAGDTFEGLVNLSGIKNEYEIKSGPNAGQVVKTANNWLQAAE